MAISKPCWLLILSATLATTASAQSTRTLADGRTVTVSTTVTGCTGAVTADRADGVAVHYDCTVASEEGGARDTAGTAELLLFTNAGTMSPDTLLAQTAAEWWSGFAEWPQDQKDNAISRTQKTLAGGAAAPLVCLHRDNIDALDGDAVCVLDTGGVQLAVFGKSTMALTADNAVDAALSGVTIR